MLKPSLLITVQDEVVVKASLFNKEIKIVSTEDEETNLKQFNDLVKLASTYSTKESGIIAKSFLLSVDLYISLPEWHDEFTEKSIAKDSRIYIKYKDHIFYLEENFYLETEEIISLFNEEIDNCIEEFTLLELEYIKDNEYLESEWIYSRR